MPEAMSQFCKAGDAYRFSYAPQHTRSMWATTVDRRADDVAISKQDAFNLLSCGGGARARKSFVCREETFALLGVDCPVRDVAGCGHSQFFSRRRARLYVQS